MRTLCFLTVGVLAICFLAGCGLDDEEDDQGASAQPERPKPPTLPPYAEGERAPREYLAKPKPRPTEAIQPRKPDPRFELDDAKWVKTQDNLAALGKAVLAWRKAKGSFPETLQDLVDGEIITVDMLRSPSDGKVKIVYRPSPTMTLEDDWILLYDPIVNGGKYQAFLGDGNVSAVGIDTLERIFTAP